MSSSAAPPRRLDSSAVDDLREQLAAAQQKLGKALKLLRQASERDKNAGSVDVDFVKTKPGNLRCKKDVNVKTILHEFHAEFPEGCVTALMGPSGAGSEYYACSQFFLKDAPTHIIRTRQLQRRRSSTF